MTLLECLKLRAAELEQVRVATELVVADRPWENDRCIRDPWTNVIAPRPRRFLSRFRRSDVRLLLRRHVIRCGRLSALPVPDPGCSAQSPGTHSQSTQSHEPPFRMKPPGFVSCTFPDTPYQD